MIIEKINLQNGTALGMIFEMENAPLIVIKADRGFVMCGYLDISTANKLGDIAVRVSGVRNFEDVLKADVADLTDNAKELGIKNGMNAREALERMF